MLDKLNGIISGPMRTLLQDPVIVQRGDRYCVPVKAEHRGAFGGIVHDTSAPPARPCSWSRSRSWTWAMN